MQETDITIKTIDQNKAPKIDPAAVPPIEAAESIEAAMADQQDQAIKIKIVKEYFLQLQTLLTFDDGTQEERVERIPIKQKFTLFETQSEALGIAPFELEIHPKKGDPFLIRLNKDKTVSSIILYDKEYLMRGH